MSGVDVLAEPLPETYSGTLFDYTAGVYCGVLVTESVMRKLAALQAEHVEKVRRVLSDNVDGVFPSSWTLHYPEGKQTVVRFIDRKQSASDHIKYATVMRQPVPVALTFYADSMDEAVAKADARHAALARIGGES